MPPKKLPAWPAAALMVVQAVLLVVMYWVGPFEMDTVTYHQLVRKAYLLVFLVWAVYVTCYFLWLRHYREARREMLANLDAAHKYIHRGVPSARCLSDSEAEEHMLTARNWQLAEPQAPELSRRVRQGTA